MSETTHTPQGDGNSDFHKLFEQEVETTHTPQGDGNPSHAPAHASNNRNNPHPARGRKLEDDNVADNRIETTHTPQGDGNPIMVQMVYYVVETTHTPQGDGNCCPYIKYSLRIGNNPHPARGRKQEKIVLISITSRNNPHPARGRKRLIYVRPLCAAGNNPHPARGTETRCFQTDRMD